MGYVIAFLLGVVVGAFVVCMWALCVASKQGDEAMDKITKNGHQPSGPGVNRTPPSTGSSVQGGSVND